ncbi:MAG TPA: ATP-binding protein [Pirellulales bacterium]|nr:ATP-binding protein [Pirellulales bacterium]
MLILLEARDVKAISETQVLERLAVDNPWWEAGEVDHPFFTMRPRAYLELFFPLVKADSPRRAVILLGPRRVGKTVMIHQAAKALMDKGVPGANICYVNLEVPTYNGLSLEDFVRLASSIDGADPKQRRYVFFDEIQYLRNWEVHLKTIVDSRKNIKCIASGSAAAALRLKSNESGAGRFTDFLLPPVTFYEYLDLQGLDNEIAVKGDHEYSATDITSLNRHFIHYLNYGGYPEVIFSKEIQENPGRFLRSDIIDKVLLRDLPSLYGIQDIQELNSLFTSLAYNTANEVSLDTLSQKSGVAKNTIKRYIEYLESAFLIKIIHRVDHSCKKFKRANFFKVYLTNPCMRSALFSPLRPNDDGMGHLVETGIFAQWFHAPADRLHYARWSGGEVDMVYISDDSPSWCVEAKWTDEFAENPHKLTSLKKFLRDNPKSNAMVTTKTKLCNAKLDGQLIEFTPASVYCYTLGRNIIEGRRTHRKAFKLQLPEESDLV